MSGGGDDSGGGLPLGALLLAVGRLRADGETVAEIARMLGAVDAAEAVPSRAQPERPSARPGVPPREPVRERPPVDEVAGAGGAADVARSGAVGAVRVVLRSGPAAVTAAAGPAPLGEAQPFRAEPPELAPLLRPLAARAIVGAAVAAARPAGALDVDRVVERIARRWPLEPLPWRRRAVVPPAVLVLVDRGPGMAPFARDADELIARIRSVAGRDRTRVERVYGSPRSRGPGKAAALELPPRGTAVIALTDAGIAPAEERASRTVEHWRELAEALRERGCRLVAFVPYPPRRWPRGLAEEVPLVPWDRPTGVATVIRALRRAGAGAWSR